MVTKDIQRSWHVSETKASHSTYYTIWKGSMAIATPKVPWQTVARGYAQPTRMGVAIAIDPFQGVYVGAYLKMMGPQCLDDLNT